MLVQMENRNNQNYRTNLQSNSFDVSCDKSLTSCVKIASQAIGLSLKCLEKNWVSKALQEK